MSTDKTNQEKASFEKPRHWVALEELSPGYWSDAQAQTRRGQEFYDKPIETLEAIEKMDKGGVNRRDFLTIMGASMAMASFACARRPVNKIIPYVVQPQELTPGVPLYYASTIRTRGQPHSVVVRTREGRPIKLEGNELSPINSGALGIEGQASILGLYDPDRLKGPMKGSKGGSKSSESWAGVDAAVVAALKEAKRVRIVSYPEQSESTRRIMKEFMAGFADAKWLEVDPLGRDDLADGQAESYGNRVIPTYHFDQAQVVVSFGADFLSTWGNEVEYSRDWSKTRKLLREKDALSKLFVYESNFSVTGANADERIGILPGTEIAAAVAVAYELIVTQKRGKFAGNPEVISILGSIGVDTLLGKAGGLDHGKLKQTAQSLWEARGKGLVVGNGSVALQAIVNLLNSNLENEGKTVDGNGDVSTVTPMTRQLGALQSELESSQIDVVIFHRVNPVYFLPNGDAFANALKKAKTVVSIQDRLDETNVFADVILAENHDLESWGDSKPRPSFYSVQQPTISPIADTRCLEDILINWVRAGAKGTGLLAATASNASGSYYDYLKENWKQTLLPVFGKGQSFSDFWETALQKGVLLAKAAPARERAFQMASLKLVPRAVSQLKSLTVSKSSHGPAIEGSGIQLGVYAPAGLGDGSYANNPWLQELPDPITTATWDNYLNIGPAFAAELGLALNDVVLVKTDTASFEIPVFIQPGIVKGAATVALGYGRTIVGKVGNHVGVNAFRAAKFNSDNGFTYSGIPVSIAKTGKKYEIAITQGHNRTEGRPIINDITYSEYKTNPEHSNHTDPHLRLKEVPTLWAPPIDYKKQPYKWIMGVDLNSCTGCGACVVACQAENNIPVVGRDRVRQSREMHWIRIDRYYSGSEENPNVVFQPMMCQHCENAPCETVCPVVATSHSEDGLNQMTYSRCVGTRYCQNNCPYKARRFNFFDHWKDYKDTMNLVWNPDVTVRSRGIMEKCTFCIQRINEAKGKAKDRQGKIKDQDLQTACQQTCPTDAIVFGNENDGEAVVNSWKTHGRSFRALEILNTRPSIHYLTKVRNSESTEHAHGEAGDEHHG